MSGTWIIDTSYLARSVATWEEVVITYLPTYLGNCIRGLVRIHWLLGLSDGVVVVRVLFDCFFWGGFALF